MNNSGADVERYAACPHYKYADNFIMTMSPATLVPSLTSKYGGLNLTYHPVSTTKSVDFFARTKQSGAALAVTASLCLGNRV